MNLTHSQLLALIEYNPDTGVFVNRATRFNSPAGKTLGVKHTNGYLQARILYKNYLLHRLAWFYVYGEWPTKHIDHLNGNKQDNRLGNLRLASNAENMQNVKRAQARSKSGIRGVSWDASRDKWTAHICINGKQKNLGRFSELNEAAAAYKRAQKVLHPFAN